MSTNTIDTSEALSDQPTLDSEIGWLAREVQWHKDFDVQFGLVKETGTKLTTLTLTTALAGEVGEVANIVRKWADGVRPLDMDHLAEEAADILVFLLMLAGYSPFDLQKAYELKKGVLVERWTERRSQRARDQQDQDQ